MSSKLLRVSGAIVGTVVACLLCLFVLLELPSVRARLLDRGQIYAEQQLGLFIDAGSLDLSVLERSIEVRNVRLAASRGERPFLEADSARVFLDWKVFRGAVEVRRLELVRPRLTLVRHLDQVTNLPRGTRTGRNPEPVQLGTIDVREFSLAFEDEAADRLYTVGPIDLTIDVTPSRRQPGAFGPSPFAVRLGRTAVERQQQTLAGTISGHLGFDGARVSVPDIHVDTPEGRLTLEGWTDVMGEMPRVEARGQFDLNLARMNRFAGPLASSLAGTATGTLTVSGALFEPVLDFDLAAQRVEYRSLKGLSVSIASTFAAGQLEVQRLDVSSGFGDVHASGAIAFSDGSQVTPNSRLAASWRGLDVDPLLGAMNVKSPMAVGVRTTGQLDLRLTGVDPLGPDWLAHLSGGGSVQLLASGTGLSPAGTIELDLSSNKWSLKHSLQWTAARLSLEGVVSGTLSDEPASRDSTLTGMTRLDAEDLNAVVSLVRDAGVDLPALTEDIVGALRGTVTLHGTVRHPSLQAILAGDGIHASGLPVADLTSILTVDRERLRVGSLEARLATASLTAAGDYSWSGRISVRFGASVADLGELVRSLDAAAADLKVGSTLAGLTLAGTARLDGEAWGTMRSLNAKGTLQGQAISIDDTNIGELNASLALSGPTLHVDAEAPQIAVRAQGDVEMREPFTFEARADFNGSALRDIVPARARGELEDATIVATVRARGGLRRPLESSAEVDLRALDARVAGNRIVLEDSAALSISPARLAVSSLRLRVGQQSQVRLTGSLARDSTSDGLELRASGALSDLADLARSLSATQPVTAVGAFDLGLRVDGTLGSPIFTGTATVSGSSLRYGDVPPVSDLSLEATVERTQIVLQSFTGTWQNARLSGEGSVPWRVIAPAPPSPVNKGTLASWGAEWLASLPEEPRRAVLRVQATGITPEVLAPFVEPSRLKQIDGSVSASLSVESDAASIEQLRASLVLEKASVTLAGVPISQVEPTRVELADGYARIGSFRWVAEGNEILVTGGAMVARSAPQLDLSVRGALDLRVLGAFASGIAAGGIARPNITISGPADSPVVVGSVGIAGGELRVETPPLVASDLDGSIDIAENRALSLSLTGLVNGGSARVTGSVDVGQLTDPRGTISLSARNVVLEYPDGFQTESNAEIALTLDGVNSSLAGRVEVLGGTYREPILLTRGLLAGSRRGGIATTASESSVLPALGLNLAVTTVDDVRVENNYARLSLSANLSVLGTLERPGAVGRIEAAEDGEIFLAGNTYRIESLVVELTDARAIAPEVNFLAETRMGDVPIEVALDCRAAAPCERDVKSLAPGVTNEQAEALLFGVSGDPSLAGAQLARLLSGDVLGIVGQTIGLDTLRLGVGSGAGADLFDDPTLVAGDADPASRLTLGKRLGEHAELVYSQDLADSGFTTSTTYFAPRETSARVLLLDDQSRSFEFRHEPRFGAARVRTPPVLPGPRIAEVRLDGSPGFPAQELRGRLELTEGDRFQFRRWQEDRDRLVELYHSRGFLEARIRARRLPTGDTMVLEYTLDRGAATQLEVNGVDLPDQVRTRILERWKSAIFDGFLERDARLIVREYLLGEGRMQAGIEARIERDDERGVKTLRIDVTPGPFLSRRLEFDGNVVVSTERLYKAAELVGSLMAWMDPAPFELAMESFYREDGLLSADAEVQDPAIQDGTSVVRAVIREGPIWSVGRVTVESGDALPAGTLAGTPALSSGARYQPSLVAEAVDGLERSFREAGFLNVRSTVETVLRQQESQVDVHVLIQPGPRSILADVNVEGVDPGNSRVTRAIGLKPGEPVALSAVAETRRRLYDSGAYRSVDIQLEPAGGADSGSAAPTEGERAVVARVTVVERQRYRFRYGLALNDEVVAPDARQQRVRFGADLENRNLFGRGATAALSVRLRRDQQVSRVLLGSNRLLGLPVRSNLFYSRARERINTTSEFPIVSDVSELSVEQTFQVRRLVQVRYGYGFGGNRTRIEGQEFDVRVRLARLTTGLFIDQRTNPFDPAGGRFVSASLELSRPGLGSDLSFLKSFIQAFQFVSMPRNIVLAAAIRLGMARTYDNEELIPTERFFGGGATSVRGYRQDDLGRRSVVGGPDGGRALFIANAELRFPIRRRLRGVGFVDLGNVYRTIGEIDLADLQAGIGAGVRVDTPIGLLRLDLAVPVSRRSFDQKWAIHVGLGHAF